MAGYYRKRGKDSYELTYRGKYKTIKVNSDREAELSLAAFIVEVEKGNFRKPATLQLNSLFKNDGCVITLMSFWLQELQMSIR